LVVGKLVPTFYEVVGELVEGKLGLLYSGR